MEISNVNDFISWINNNPISESYTETTSYYFPVHFGMFVVEDKAFSDIDLTNKQFIATEFISCVFNKCNLNNTIFQSCTMKNCTFKNCSIDNSKFMEIDLIQCKFESCCIVDLELCDIITDELIFKNCNDIFRLRITAEILGINNCSEQSQNLSFKDSYVSSGIIHSNKINQKDKIIFSDCIVQESNFYNIDLSNSRFEGCNLSLNQFSDCVFSDETFADKNGIPANEYNYVDLRTILNSSKQKFTTLESLFGITYPDIKNYLIDMTSKVEFQSIFISYSFKDKIIANRINEELRKRGISTFLWEKDAPYGKTLKEIMSKNIKEKDRILFIASKNSLKSQACHYELTQGRKKQEKIWENILFPIHIDNFLFEVTKEMIRPKEMQDEYWSNIKELKNINSINFSQFVNQDTIDETEFGNQIFNLLTGLRKGK